VKRKPRCTVLDRLSWYLPTSFHRNFRVVFEHMMARSTFDATDVVSGEDSGADSCPACTGQLQLWVDRCPHCATPVTLPNVRFALRTNEVKALNKRYQTALDDVSQRGSLRVTKDFERVVTSHSRAVVNRTPQALLQMLNSEDDASGNFYALTAAHLRQPDSDLLNRMRPIVDQSIFPNYYRDIQFAGLSLSQHGLTNYGSCSISLKSEMIEHRATVFDNNILTWMIGRNPNLTEFLDIPPGHRATWTDRARLAVAKLATLLHCDFSEDAFGELLLRCGTDSTDDDFIEVHLWGKITTLTIESISLGIGTTRLERTYLSAIRDILTKLEIPETSDKP
jgi:hypothetical protein